MNKSLLSVIDGNSRVIVKRDAMAPNLHQHVHDTWNFHSPSPSPSVWLRESDITPERAR